MIDLWAPENEAEAEAVRELLADHGIEAQIITLATRPYPGLPHSGWGVLRVREQDVTRARALLDEWTAGREADQGADEQPGDGVGDRLDGAAASTARERVRPVMRIAWSVAKALIVVASLTVNVILFVKYVWHPQQDEVIVEGTDGRRISRSLYEPFATFPFRTDVYRRDGELIASWFDDDEDGWYERAELFDDGQLVWTNSDDDQNGVLEVQVGFVQARRTVEYRDIDGDSRFDEAVSYSAELEPRAWLLDRDADGFPEVVRCVDASGDTRSASLIACDLGQPPR
jgi:hypothetical protein